LVAPHVVGLGGHSLKGAGLVGYGGLSNIAYW
jgi:hypothetical protein